jgi:hypothetical protein
MRRCIITMAVLTTSLFAMPSIAALFTGNDLHEKLSSNVDFDLVQGQLYVIGIADAMHAGLVTSNSRGCFPSTVTGRQLVAVAKAQLDKAPQDRHLPAAQIVGEAFRVAFPCKGK